MAQKTMGKHKFYVFLRYLEDSNYGVESNRCIVELREFESPSKVKPSMLVTVQKGGKNDYKATVLQCSSDRDFLVSECDKLVALQDAEDDPKNPAHKSLKKRIEEGRRVIKINKPSKRNLEGSSSESDDHTEIILEKKKIKLEEKKKKDNLEMQKYKENLKLYEKIKESKVGETKQKSKDDNDSMQGSSSSVKAAMKGGFEDLISDPEVDRKDLKTRYDEMQHELRLLTAMNQSLNASLTHVSQERDEALADRNAALAELTKVSDELKREKQLLEVQEVLKEATSLLLYIKDKGDNIREYSKKGKKSRDAEKPKEHEKVTDDKGNTSIDNFPEVELSDSEQASEPKRMDKSDIEPLSSEEDEDVMPSLQCEERFLKQLRFKKEDKEVQEIYKGSGIYVATSAYAMAVMNTTTATAICRKLVNAVFTTDALIECSCKGQKADSTALYGKAVSAIKKTVIATCKSKNWPIPKDRNLNKAISTLLWERRKSFNEAQEAESKKEKKNDKKVEKKKGPKTKEGNDDNVIQIKGMKEEKDDEMANKGNLNNVQEEKVESEDENT